jgi:hypothetical protein
MLSGLQHGAFDWGQTGHSFLIPAKLTILEGNLCMPSSLHGLSVGCVLHNEDSAGNHRVIFQILLNCKVNRASVLQKVSTSDM